jgi:hypothetical protein
MKRFIFAGVFAIAMLLNVVVAQAQCSMVGRITISIPRVELQVSYAEYGMAFSQGLQCAEKDAQGRYLLPNDDKIYEVVLHRQGERVQSPALANLVIMPGETLEILAMFQNGNFDYRIKGSRIFEADYAYNKAYHTNDMRAGTLHRQKFSGEWDNLSRDRQRELDEELNRLERDLKSRRCAYIKNNPSSPLSAYYYTCQPFTIDQAGEYYVMLSESLREGVYKPMFEFANELYIRMLNA